MSRGLAHKREVRNKTIARKKRICISIYGGSPHRLYESPEPGYWYKVDGKYAKGKIYCGCKMCKYNRHYGLPTVRTKKEMEKFRIELQELNE